MRQHGSSRLSAGRRLRREEAVDDYSRRAMTWLESAAGHGLKDAALVENDADFQPLRRRSDYQLLVSRLKDASKP